jgi:ATP-dependent RNA helicase SUPV3L1/SUV3
MVEAEATQAGDAPEGAPAASIPDWSDVRGFQVLAASGAEPAADPEARAVELGKELAARAARFAQSVDDSIVLASDGIIRWLGDPIARLVGGEDVLKPRGVLLADDTLIGESREAVEKRLALWISAHVRKVLGPLEALADTGAITEHARELAQRIVQALGVLERERVRQQVKTLDQNARSSLRKLGVRFGALYIYVPALLKPGARTLCSQLWGLRRGVEPGCERLLAFAASGRTSFAAEAPLGPDTYRVAGFRLCGDRVVRVDIVERLTDLIRAAIPDHMRPGGRPPSEAYGFVVSPQMTSLTGCAGDSFASILRSLGFESHRVTRADYEAATRKAPTEPARAVEEAPSVEAGPTETGVGREDEADATETADVVESSPEAEGVEAAEAAPPNADPISSDEEPTPIGEAAPAVVEVAEDGEGAVSAPRAGESSPVEDLAPAVADSAAPAPAIDDPPGAPEAAPPAEPEWIEIWRPAPRRRPAPAPRAAESEGARRPPRPRRDSDRHQARDREATPAPAPAAAAPEPAAPDEPRRAEGGRHDRGEGRRPHRFKGPRPEEGRPGEASRAGAETARPVPKKEPRPQPVDMDSPFAKLLALKPLLERRDKRT